MKLLSHLNVGDRAVNESDILLVVHICGAEGCLARSHPEAHQGAKVAAFKVKRLRKVPSVVSEAGNRKGRVRERGRSSSKDGMILPKS
jgi:hypothetical protein